MTRFVDLGHPAEHGPATSARFADDSCQVPLASIAGVPGVVVDAPVPPRAVAVALDESAVQDRAVLIRTGRDERWGAPSYQEAAPYLAPRRSTPSCMAVRRCSASTSAGPRQRPIRHAGRLRGCSVPECR